MELPSAASHHPLFQEDLRVQDRDFPLAQGQVFKEADGACPTHIKLKSKLLTSKKPLQQVEGDLKFFGDFNFSMATGLRNRRAGEGGEEREGKKGRAPRRERAALVHCHGNPLASAANCQSQSASQKWAQRGAWEGLGWGVGTITWPTPRVPHPCKPQPCSSPPSPPAMTLLVASPPPDRAKFGPAEEWEETQISKWNNRGGREGVRQGGIIFLIAVGLLSTFLDQFGPRRCICFHTPDGCRKRMSLLITEIEMEMLLPCKLSYWGKRKGCV